VLSEDDVGKLLAAAKGDSLAYALLCLVAGTGLRRGELLGLPWRNVDLDRGLVVVNQSRVAIRGKMVLSEPKTGAGVRVLELPDFCVRALKAHKRVNGAAEYVFTWKNGKPLDARGMARHIWYPLLEKAKLPQQPFHSTRHFAITLRIALGENPRSIMQLAGHANTTTTMNTYAEYWPRMGREAAKKTDSFFRKLTKVKSHT